MDDSTFGAGDDSPPADGATDARDPAFRPAMALIGLLLALSVAGVVHSLLATFGA